MLRITESTSVELTTIYLEGKLLRPWIEEVRAVVAEARVRGIVRLNLKQLWFVDNAGVDLLKDMRTNGIELVDCSPLIEGLLARS